MNSQNNFSAKRKKSGGKVVFQKMGLFWTHHVLGSTPPWGENISFIGGQIFIYNEIKKTNCK